MPINSRLAMAEVDFILGDCGAGALIVDPELSEQAAQLSARPQALPDVAELRDGGARQDGELPDVPDDALATVLYTSGTTGVPKGVMRTHRANAWNVVNSALGSPRTPDDVELFNLPAFGIGLLHFAMPALLGGAALVLDHTFAADRVWRLLQERRATRTFLAPTMLSAMLEVPGQESFDLSALQTIYTAYEFLNPLRGRALQRFGDRFVYMYGLTEAQLTCARRGEFVTKPGSVGGAMGATRIRVLDAHGQAAPLDQIGEIAIHGPATMSGYLNRPEETAAALRDGWVLTGDLGRIDADGDLYYTGRSKEMIKSGGFSVDPREVERALLSVAGVREAAVIGVPDPHWGEMVVAFVVSDIALDERGTIDACREQIAGYKLPKRVLVLDAMPVNATGKVERRRLRESFALAAGGP